MKGQSGKAGRSATGGARMPADERRSQILAEAARVFSTSGYRGTTTREIAGACRISEAALYRHFHSKAALFCETLRTRIEAIQSDSFLAQLPSDQPIEATLEMIARRILHVGSVDPLIQRLLMAASVEGDRETRRLFLDWRLPFVIHLEKSIRSGIERGELQAVEPLLTARAFVGLVMDCALSCNLWPELGYGGPDSENLIRNNVPLFARGLKRPPGPNRRSNRPGGKPEKEGDS